jgi:hypothetical protein
MRQYDDLLIDALLDRGFTTEEAQRLIVLQERVERERQRQSSQTGARQSEPNPQPGKDYQDYQDYDDPRAR